MIERIESIYRRKSYKRLRAVLEELYVQYKGAKDNHISISELARKIKKDASSVGKILVEMEEEGIVDVTYSMYSREKKYKPKERVKARRLYRLSPEAYNIIEKTKTANRAKGGFFYFIIFIPFLLGGCILIRTGDLYRVEVAL